MRLHVNSTIAALLLLVSAGKASGSGSCSVLFEPQKMSLQQMQAPGYLEGVPSSGVMIDFHWGEKVYLTSQQRLRKVKYISPDDQSLIAKIFNKSVDTKFLSAAVVNEGSGEKASFYGLVEREFHYMKQEDSESLFSDAVEMTLARYAFSDSVWSLFSAEVRERSLALARRYKLKPKPAPVLKVGSESIKNGVEIGVLRLKLSNGKRVAFFNTSSRFSSIQDVAQILNHLQNNSSIPWEQVIAVDFFHNHPATVVAPLSAADNWARVYLGDELSRIAQRPVEVVVHAVQKIQEEAIIFSSK